MPLPFWGFSHFLRKVSLLAAKSRGKRGIYKEGRNLPNARLATIGEHKSRAMSIGADFFADSQLPSLSPLTKGGI